MSAKTALLDSDFRRLWHDRPLFSALQRSHCWYQCGYSLWEARRTGRVYQRVGKSTQEICNGAS